MSGLDFLARCRGDGTGYPSTAFVTLIAIASEQIAVEALKAGAQDYLVKERITTQSLKVSIERSIQKISLLRTLQEERDRLARSLAEKETLLQEVHHRVKNNLQVISSLLRMQAGNSKDPVLAAALRDSQHRVESMALIHEQLYESSNLREVDLAKNAGILLTHLLHSFGADRITAKVTMEPLRLSVEQAIPAGLVLNELIANALEHAFPDGREGSILVEGRLASGQVDLAVRDDGVGLPSGFDPSGTAGSLGLRLVAILVRQLKGSLKLECPSGSGGSVFRIQFPHEV
jgi:two-component sensor histidine kinase